MIDLEEGRKTIAGLRHIPNRKFAPKFAAVRRHPLDWSATRRSEAA